MLRAPLIVAALILSSTTFAVAQSANIQRPDAPAPASTAAFEQREDWCRKYATWLVERTPAAERPADVRASHLFEVEFNSCKLDPAAYERETRADADRLEATAQG